MQVSSVCRRSPSQPFRPNSPSTMAALPVLILDGEEVEGGQQSRVMNTTVMVPRHSVFELKVTCLERGPVVRTVIGVQTGRGRLPELAPPENGADGGGRWRASQAAVWSEIADRQVSMRSRSATDALHDLYQDQHDVLAAAEQQLKLPDNGAFGVEAANAGRAMCADVFDCASTLSAILVAAGALVCARGRGVA